MSYHEPPARRRVPRWLLLAASPAALALGLIVGVAASAYGPVPEPGPEPGVQEAPQTASQQQDPPQEQDGPAAPDAEDQPDPDAEDQPAAPVAETVALLPPPPDDSAYSSGDKLAPEAPSLAEVRTLVDARTVLAAEFGAFRTAGGAELFHADYQLARDANYNTMLVGIVKLADYNSWLTAVREHGDELRRWLMAAARRVRTAAENEGFGLSWALLEVVPDRPYGFMADEVTPMPRGEGYLVTRPLAAVTDFAGPTVVVAAVAGSGPATSPAPANVYGPVLRFDPTDLYRPQTLTP